MRKINGIKCYGSAHEGQNYHVICQGRSQDMHDLNWATHYSDRICCDCELTGWDLVVGDILDRYSVMGHDIVEIAAI